MLTLVRTGAECIALTATSELSEIRHKLSHWGIRISMGAEEALGRYGAARRLIFFKARPEESLGISSAVEIYVCENSFEML